MCVSCICFDFFFFQAEDGIRDKLVTGVQTCALPILWHTALDPDPGLTVVEIMNAAKRHEIRGMYIMGENPAMSDPDVQHARAALALLECLVVQDIFLTETASFADVILPASAFPEKAGTFTNTDRRVQLGRPALRMP